MKKMSAISELLNIAEFLSLTELLLDCQLGSSVSETRGEGPGAGGDTGALGEGGGEGRCTRSGDKETVS